MWRLTSAEGVGGEWCDMASLHHHFPIAINPAWRSLPAFVFPSAINHPCLESCSFVNLPIQCLNPFPSVLSHPSSAESRCVLDDSCCIASQTISRVLRYNHEKTVPDTPANDPESRSLFVIRPDSDPNLCSE